MSACDELDDPFIDDDEDVDELVIKTTSWDNWWTGSAFAMTDPLLESPANADSAARTVADSADQYFTPAGCATVSRDGGKLTYTLDDCSGLLAQTTIDGTLEVSFATAGDAIVFEVSSSDLEIDGEPAQLSVNGTYRTAGETRTVEYSAMPALTGAGDGISAQFDGTATWTAGSNCVTSDGSGQVTMDGRTWDTSLVNFTRCGQSCPSAGMASLRDDPEAITLIFDGRQEATLMHTATGPASVALDCEPAP